MRLSPVLARRTVPGLLTLGLLAAACSSSDDPADQTIAAADAPATSDVDTSSSETTVPAGSDSSADAPDSAATASASSTFQVEVWADNWMAVHVNGEQIGEDSVSITTERSFNAETFTFEAAYPFTIAIEAKDFKETDSGIEYIGERNQQMGDGGLIAQVADTSTGEIVAVTNSQWSTMVIHRAPLNTECVGDADPDATCQFESIEAPAGWTGQDFDDSSWAAASEWSESDVSPRQGYDEVNWDAAAQLIWGPDLEVDNTVLARITVASS